MKVLIYKRGIGAARMSFFPTHATETRGMTIVISICIWKEKQCTCFKMCGIVCSVCLQRR